MAGRRQIDQPRARLHQRSDAVDQHEMAEMVGAELGLEPVRRLAEWRRHDAGVGDDEIERLAVGDKRVGASAHACKRREIELDQFKPAAVRGVGAHRARSPLWPWPDRAPRPTTSAPCAASARAVSTPRPADTPVTSTRLPLSFTPSSTSSVVDSAPKDFDMIGSPGSISEELRFGAAAENCQRREARNKRRMPPVDIRRDPSA